MNLEHELTKRLTALADGRTSPETVRQWICENFIPAPDVDIPDLPDIDPVDLDFGMDSNAI